MGEFSFDTPRCPATNEPCSYLEQQLIDANDPDSLRQTLGESCRTGRREAKLVAMVTQSTVCGLEYADSLEDERASRETTKHIGNGAALEPTKLAGVYNAKG